jgi:hypothetical protein
MLPVVVQGLQSQIDAIQTHLAAQAAEAKASQRERMTVFIMGATAGMVAAILLLLATYLLVQIGVP